VDLVVTHSITSPGHLSLRAVDEYGNHLSLQHALEANGFEAGDLVALIDEEEVTAQSFLLEPIIEITESSECSEDCVCKE